MESSNLFRFSVDCNSSPEYAISFGPTYPLQAGPIGARWTSIASVLAFGAQPQVSPHVIQTVAVFVIRHFESNNKTVHENSFVVALHYGCSLGVPLLVNPLSAPLPLIQPFEIGVVHQRNLALGEGNLFHTGQFREA
jgi:hypothetical protein